MVSASLNQKPRMISPALIFTKRDFAIYSGRDGSKVGGMKTNKSTSLINRENELRIKFSTMTSEEVREMMETTDNTTTKLICWEYLQTL